MIHCDFQSDLRAWLIERLRDMGVAPDVRADAASVARDFFQACARRIRAAPRDVKISELLMRRMMAGELDAEILTAIEAIVDCSLCGLSLIPFQTANVSILDARDHMHADWNIHHLHVGSVLKHRTVKRELVRRGARPEFHTAGRAELLFVWVAEDALHLIDVRDHHAWADEGLLEVVLASWPELLAPHSVPGVSRATVVDAAARLQFRACGLGTAVTLSNGLTYLPPGGGYVQAGYHLRAVRDSCRLLGSARAFQADVRANEATVRAAIAATGRSVGEADLHLEMRVLPDARVMLFEHTTGVTFDTGTVISDRCYFEAATATEVPAA